MPKNAIGDVVTRLGGAVPTAAAAGVAVNTVMRALKTGRFVSAVACIKLARAVHPTDDAAQARLIAKLAGLPD